mmetsp:Transcript_18913/g.75947  ORF Transcript_18913/g.75947 Transcript_18913/m.75947 type:complete len:128 (+) Transcript_18913:4605-4988(+)
MTSLEARFDEAVNIVSSGGVNLGSQEDQLKLYGYYTRVKKGVCKGPRPAPWELRKQAKYDAWKDASERARYIVCSCQSQENLAGPRTMTKSPVLKVCCRIVCVVHEARTLCRSTLRSLNVWRQVLEG